MLEEIRAYCLSKPVVTEDLPFDEHTLVTRVGNKIFCFISLDSEPLRISLKAEPEKAQQLREQYEAIQPGYHLNKTHWNTITLNSSISFTLVKDLIDDSYQLIFKSLPAKLRAEINAAEQ
jgi:predicted DNA-binding protein (MmcQ/YjbR family)